MLVYLCLWTYESSLCSHMTLPLWAPLTVSILFNNSVYMFNIRKPKMLLEQHVRPEVHSSPPQSLAVIFPQLPTVRVLRSSIDDLHDPIARLVDPYERLLET